MRKFYTVGDFDKQPILYRDVSELHYKIPTLVHYIETHALNGTFECTSPFLKELSCTRQKILSYMDMYGCLSYTKHLKLSIQKTRKNALNILLNTPMKMDSSHIPKICWRNLEHRARSFQQQKDRHCVVEPNSNYCI